MARKNHFQLGLWGFLAVGAVAALAVASRTWFDTPNFKPVGALCLLTPILLAHACRWAWLAPLLIVLGSEVLLSPSAGFLALPLIISWTINVWIGFAVRRAMFDRPGNSGSAWMKPMATGILATGAASCQFYLITNFAVWLGSSWYARDAFGLLECYAAGLPFFRWTLQADLLFAGLPLMVCIGATYWARQRSVSRTAV